MTIEEMERVLRDDNGLELVVTPLEPADGRANGGSPEMPAHVVQYYNKLGQDTIMVVIGNQHKIIAMDGKVL